MISDFRSMTYDFGLKMSDSGFASPDSILWRRMDVRFEITNHKSEMVLSKAGGAAAAATTAAPATATAPTTSSAAARARRRTGEDRRGRVKHREQAGGHRIETCKCAAGGLIERWHLTPASRTATDVR
jgi:hypothetical protein